MIVLLQTLSQCRDVLEICQQILTHVQGADPALVLLLQEQVRTLRYQLAEISLQAQSIRSRIQQISEQL